MTNYSGNLKAADGSSIDVALTYNPPAVVVTPPTTGPIPTNPAPTTVYIGGSSYALSSVNGVRGTNQIVAYQGPLTMTPTNMWGPEIVVNANNVVTDVNNRQASASATGTVIPSDGYVISAHDTSGPAGAWLLKYGVKGATVSFTAPVTPPGPPVVVPPAVTGAYLSAYWMIYSDSPAVHATSLPATASELRIAFMFNNGVLTGNSPFGATTMASELNTLVQRETNVCLAIGGGGNTIDLSNADVFLARWQTASKILGITPGGINIDLEYSFNSTQLIAVLRKLRSTYGPTFKITWSPNGSNVDQYLVLVIANPDLCDEFGQQFYDASMSWSAVDGRISQAKSAGLPMSKYALGFMIGAEPNYETVADCVTWMTNAKAKYGINRAYWWELSRAGTTDAINGVAALY